MSKDSGVDQTINVLRDCLTDKSSMTEAITLLSAALFTLGHSDLINSNKILTGAWTKNLKTVRNINLFLQGVVYGKNMTGNMNGNGSNGGINK